MTTQNLLTEKFSITVEQILELVPALFELKDAIQKLTLTRLAIQNLLAFKTNVDMLIGKLLLPDVNLANAQCLRMIFCPTLKDLYFLALASSVCEFLPRDSLYNHLKPYLTINLPCLPNSVSNTEKYNKFCRDFNSRLKVCRSTSIREHESTEMNQFYLYYTDHVQWTLVDV